MNTCHHPPSLGTCACIHAMPWNVTALPSLLNSPAAELLGEGQVPSVGVPGRKEIPGASGDFHQERKLVESA